MTFCRCISGQRIIQENLLITDITQPMQHIVCYYNYGSSSGSFQRWYHKLTREGNETKVPNRPTHLENFQYSGWYSTQQFSNGYMKLSLRSALEFNAIEGIFICRRKTEQVSVGIYYPSKSLAGTRMISIAFNIQCSLSFTCGYHLYAKRYLE